MNQIYPLFRVEYQKLKKTYWWPVWIIGGLTVISLAAIIIAWLNPYSSDIFFHGGGGSDSLRIGMYGIMFSLSMIFFIFLVLTSQSSLNQEKQLRCDLFFRCQPVNLWDITMVKYVMHVYAHSLLLLALGIIFAVILSFVMLFASGGFYPGEALYGTFLGWLLYLKAAMVLGSLFFLFSAIFRNNAFLKGLAVLGILEGVFALIETIFRNTIKLPGIFSNILSMIGHLGVEDMDSVNITVVMGDYRILIGLLFAGVCYTAATFIYKYRAKDSD
ncbi:MAG: hypothetical protein R6V48_04810 [Fidelibacterota bacterium]